MQFNNIGNEKEGRRECLVQDKKNVFLFQTKIDEIENGNIIPPILFPLAGLTLSVLSS